MKVRNSARVWQVGDSDLLGTPLKATLSIHLCLFFLLAVKR